MSKKKFTGADHAYYNGALVFEKNRDILSQILNRLCLSMKIQTLYIVGEEIRKPRELFDGIDLKRVENFMCSGRDQLYFLAMETTADLIKYMPWIQKNCIQSDFVIYTKNIDMVLPEEIVGLPHPLDAWEESGFVYLCGKTLTYHRTKVPDSFKVLAIIHCYNEEDIIAQTMEYLLDQELDLYMVDNWSTDRTYNIISDFYKRFPDRIRIERYPSQQSRFYDWYHQLERTEEISKELDYQWFIHYDSDEMRVSPWEKTTLREAIYQMDCLGYNAADNTVIDFRLTSLEQRESIFMKDTYFDFGHRPAHFSQRKSWKKTEDIDLKTSGGHRAETSNVKIFPLKILTRHYPFRTVQQAQKKIFVDRKPRFEQEKKQFGWHGQYDGIKEAMDCIYDSRQLILWTQNVETDLYIPLFLGCGIYRETDPYLTQMADDIEGKEILIYGAGSAGERVYENIFNKCKIKAWLDRDYVRIKRRFFIPIQSVEQVKDETFDYCIIANSSPDTQRQITEILMDFGVPKRKILYYPERL